MPKPHTIKSLQSILYLISSLSSLLQSLRFSGIFPKTNIESRFDSVKILVDSSGCLIVLSTILSLMDSSPDGSSLKRSGMSVAEKRQLVHELSKNPDLAFGVLQKWTCQEITEVLSAESGKERKCKGLTKAKMIDILLKTVTERNGSSATKRNSKRKRKNTHPSRYVDPTSFNVSASPDSARTKGKGIIYCKNLACQAILKPEDFFCKRCSCCICHKYDDNKDPSLWLTCNSDSPFAGESCGLTCHLDCAFKSEKSGLKEDQPSHGVDGCFYCVSCGKTNSLLECLKKQLVIANETRNVDQLCSRLVLAQKLLKGTEKYLALSENVENAVESLETDLGGPLTGLALAMRKGIVNRLGSAPKVKDLCSSALKSLEETLLDDHALPCKMQGSTKIIFEDVQATSLTLVLGSEEEPSSSGNIIRYSVWHRKVSENDYPNSLTCALVSPDTRFTVSGLTPATEYCFKVVSFSGEQESGVEETKVSTKTHQEEEEEQEESTLVNCLSTKEEEDAIKEAVPKEKAVKDENSGLAQCVKIIRELECSGHVDKNFRQKFLTWYSLRASAQERNVFKTFIDVLKDDSVALAEQLVDTFSDCISRKRSAIGNGAGGSGCSSV
ncbi:unnamed protein product [Thlaspi arvense]|uniref:Fibronectin type-III domain-containing protein n=1 Tax=Thlaspi arvense TaxID=13288 RepID=A0AAU9RU85_THLAR|nr:unnamed protein product [Thlaspi arvense]